MCLLPVVCGPLHAWRRGYPIRNRAWMDEPQPPSCWASNAVLWHRHHHEPVYGDAGDARGPRGASWRAGWANKRRAAHWKSVKPPSPSEADDIKLYRGPEHPHITTDFCRLSTAVPRDANHVSKNLSAIFAFSSCSVVQYIASAPGSLTIHHCLSLIHI